LLPQKFWILLDFDLDLELLDLDFIWQKTSSSLAA